jgi:hypothetical protein
MVKNILVPISPVDIVYNEQLTKSYKIAQKYTINYIGCGLSKKLIDMSITKTLELDKNIKHIFIEVITPENNNDIDRQHIWTKLNFIPLDLIFQHPGYLKWKYYQIALYSKNDDVTIPKADLILFFREFFKSIVGNTKELKYELGKIKKYLLNNDNNDDKSKSVIGNKNLWKSFS